jgi:tetratricopeptide (TPR) repeat protein
MRRILQLKRCAVALLVLLLTVASVHFLHAFQYKRNAHVLLRQAERARDDKDLLHALDYMNRYVTLRPEDIDSLGDYAALLETAAQSSAARKDIERAYYRQAYNVLEAALRQDPSRDDLRRQLVRIAMLPSIQRFRDAKEHVAVLLASRVDDADLEFLLARCLEGVRDPRNASETYRKVIEQDPKKIEAYVRRADLLRRHLERPKDADKVIEGTSDAKDEEFFEKGMLERNKESYQAHLAAARYYRSFRPDRAGLAAARKCLADARALAPQDADVLFESALLAAMENDAPSARKYLAEGIELHPDDARMYCQLARIQLESGVADDAVRTLEAGLERAPDNLELNCSLVELRIDRMEPEKAEKALKQLRKSGFSGRGLELLEARILLEEGEWPKALKLLQACLQEFESTPAKEHYTKQTLACMAECYGHLGRPDKRSELLKRALEMDPLWLPALKAQAETVAAMPDAKVEDVLMAYQRLKQVVPADRALAVRVAMARFITARNLRLPTKDQDWRTIDRLLPEDDPDVKKDPEALIAAANGKPDDFERADRLLKSAEKLLQDAKPGDSRLLAIHLARADLATRSLKQVDLAQKILDSAEANPKVGDRVEIRLARARLLAGGTENDKRQSIIKLAEGAEDKFSAREQDELLRGLGDILVRIGAIEDARAFWTKSLQTKSKADSTAEERLADEQRHANDLVPRFVLFDLARLAGDDKAAEQALKEIKKIEGPDGTFWRYGEACRLIRKAWDKDKGAVDEAETILAEIAKRRANWARVPALQGELNEMKDEFDLALKNYEKAFELGEQNPVTIRRYLQLLCKRKSAPDAEKRVDDLVDPAEHKFQLAQIYDSVDEWKNAKILLQSIRASNKQNRELLARVAGTFLQHGEVAEADLCEQQLEKIERRDSDGLSLATTLIKAQVRKDKGELAGATELLQRFASQCKPDDLAYVAMAMETIDPEAAEAIYRNWVDSDRKKLDRALTLAGYLGRRNCAEEALTICERHQAEFKPEVIAATVVAIIYSAKDGGLSAERADRMLKDAIARNPKSPPLLYWRASLLSYQGQYDEAISLYRQVGDSPEAINNLAWLLAFRDKADESLQLLDRAIRDRGSLVDLVDTRGVVKLRLGKKQEALADLKEAHNLKLALGLRPDASLCFHLAQALAANGNTEDAAKALDRANSMSKGHTREMLHRLEVEEYDKLVEKLSPGSKKPS